MTVDTKLKIFKEHHVNFVSTSGGQAVGECLFCGKPRHFYVNLENLLWDCKVCGLKGNKEQFLFKVSKLYTEVLNKKPKLLARLSEDRKIPTKAIKKYDVGWDIVGDRFTIPVYRDIKSCNDIRLYKLGSKTRSTWGCISGLLNMQAIHTENTVYVCEGEWDAILFDWLLRKNNMSGAVVSVPGANIFKRDWVPAFKDKVVQLLYDKDNAGDMGERLAQERLNGTTKQIRYLHWSEELPNGFDIRDWISYGIKVKKPKGCFRNLTKMFSSTPRNTEFKHASASKKSSEPTNLAPIKNKDLLATYRKWLFLPDEKIIDIIFGTAFANRMEGDPIWLFLIAPPGGSKSELLMSLSTAEEVVCMTSLTPHALVSGAVWSDGQDPSLLPKLNNKLLVLKDFTTITSMHFTQRDEIFGILRDVYDGKTEKYFGTGIKRAYESKFGILAGVTPVIETFGTIHQSLGERFLKYRLRGDTQKSEEHKIYKAISNINKEIKMRTELCEVAARCLTRHIPSKEKIPAFPQNYFKRIVALAQFTAWMRGVVERDRYTQQVLYRPSSEVGTRLAKQLVKLGIGIGIFRNKKELGEYEYECIKSVAAHTCPDRVKMIIRAFWKAKKEDLDALTTKEVSLRTNLPQATIFRLLEDLELLKAVKRSGGGNKYLWQLSSQLLHLIGKSEVFKVNIGSDK